MLKYDKLKNMNTDQETFDFKCPDCGEDGFKKGNFDIKPIGISWKPDKINNSDIKDEYIRNKLDKLPNIRKVIESIMFHQNNYKELNVICNKCKMIISIYNPIKQSDIKKWLNKHHPKYMRL